MTRAWDKEKKVVLTPGFNLKVGGQTDFHFSESY